jgi:hypothetical protein
MFLWDWCIDLDGEHIEEVFIGDTPVIKVSPRDYNLYNKGIVPNTSPPQKSHASLRKIICLVPTTKPSTTTPTKASNKSDTHVSANNIKTSTLNLVANGKNPNTPTSNKKPNGSQQSTKQVNEKCMLYITLSSNI